MKVNEFLAKIKTDSDYSAKSRLLVVRNRQDQTLLSKGLEALPKRFERICFSQFVPNGAFIPPADRVMTCLRSAIAKTNKSGLMAFVNGLSAMLPLWSISEKESAFGCIRSLLDDPELSFLLFVNSCGEEAQATFAHPRYAEGRVILVVGETGEAENLPEIRLVMPQIGALLDGRDCQDLGSYLKEYETFGSSAEPINIAFNGCTHRMSGVGDSVQQFFSAKDYLGHFCGYHGGLSESAEWRLFKQMSQSPEKPSAKDYAQKWFFSEGMQSIYETAPRKIIGLESDDREILLWLLKQSVRPKTYLGRVLSAPGFSADAFRSFYVCFATELLADPDERELCRERHAGIAYILNESKNLLDAEIADFIERTKSVDAYQIIPWLTNGTPLEQQESVRRLRQADLKTLPDSFYEAIPSLRHYLAPYALGDANLEAYFEKYRAFKIANDVSVEFCAKAKAIEYPLANIPSRDKMLKDVGHMNAALLWVDAMGLEYLPMILSLAKKRGFGVSNAIPVMARIPTSTEFNSIPWPKNLDLGCVKDLDSIIHNGVHPHGKSTDEENFLATLEVLSTTVFSLIAQGLASHKKVILTADHGSSRLAVLASQKKLAKTLSVKGIEETPDDWRYLRSDPNAAPPDLVASNLAGDYWVIKGYDRYPKQGGKLNEIHGGLTYEEVLVPFVVFEKGASFEPVQAGASPKEQLVEKEDFNL